jgi:hypothetical protein
MTAAIDQATAGREMLSTLRLLAIQGLVPNGREQVERWELALSDGEPGLGRLAAIRGVLEFFDWETGDRQYALEKVEQIAIGTRTESGIEADGSAYLSPADRETVRSALDDGAEYKRARAATCADCDADPADLCSTCSWRLHLADEYDRLGVVLGGAR